VRRHAPIPAATGALSKGRPVDNGRDNAWKPGPGPDRRMRYAAVKLELEVIADPRGTAVNRALRSPSPWAAGRRREHTEPNPLMWSQPTFEEIGGGENSATVPAGPERRIRL
jgi:hypothetical protein